MGKRAQKGQLYWLEKYGWHGRWYATVEGRRVRIARCLHTVIKPVAERKLAQLIRSGYGVLEEPLLDAEIEMARVASGEVRRRGELYTVRLTVAGRRRMSVTLTPGTNEEEAKNFSTHAAQMAVQMRKNGASPEHIENALLESAGSGYVLEKPNRLFGVFLTDDEALAILGKAGRSCVLKLAR